uniref:iron-containing alcohol dehydrogenase n=1 Tax=Cronobacter sakazakii TaxID=28141 RepID=UPI001F2C3C19
VTAGFGDMLGKVTSLADWEISRLLAGEPYCPAAPLILKGKKQTVQTTAPIALFADLELLCQAPQNMVTAGFGDMLGKVTSLADWEISRLLAGEPYCPAA